MRLLTTTALTLLIGIHALHSQEPGIAVPGLAAQGTIDVPFGDSQVHIALGHTHLIMAGESRIDAYIVGATTQAWTWNGTTTVAPLATAGLVIVAADGHLTALSESTGQPAWRAPAGIITTPLMTRAGWIFAVDDRGTLRGLRASDGATMWTATLPAPVRSAPAIDGDALFVVTTDGALSAWRVTDGSMRWTLPPRTGMDRVLAAHGRVYVAGGGLLTAYRQDTGRQHWRYPINMPTIGRMTADSRHVYVAALDNSIRAHTPQGDLAWKHDLDARVVDGLLADAGFVLVPQSNGAVQILTSALGQRGGELASTAPGSRGTTTLAASGEAATLRLARMIVTDATRTIDVFARVPLPVTAALTLRGTPVPWPPATPPRH